MNKDRAKLQLELINNIVNAAREGISRLEELYALEAREGAGDHQQQHQGTASGKNLCENPIQKREEIGGLASCGDRGIRSAERKDSSEIIPPWHAECIEEASAALNAQEQQTHKEWAIQQKYATEAALKSERQLKDEQQQRVSHGAVIGLPAADDNWCYPSPPTANRQPEQEQQRISYGAVIDDPLVAEIRAQREAIAGRFDHARCGNLRGISAHTCILPAGHGGLHIGEFLGIVFDEDTVHPMCVKTDGCDPSGLVMGCNLSRGHAGECHFMPIAFSAQKIFLKADRQPEQEQPLPAKAQATGALKALDGMTVRFPLTESPIHLQHSARNQPDLHIGGSAGNIIDALLLAGVDDRTVFQLAQLRPQEQFINGRRVILEWPKVD